MSTDRNGSMTEVGHPALPSTAPALSVVVPVHQGSENLRRVLIALSATELPRTKWELIVVDDASTDGSAEIAAAHADVVVRLYGEPRGPAYARNRGFDVSRGSFVAFVDADVLVHPGALSRMLDAIREDSRTGAIIGSYDASSNSTRLVSEYRNLLRHVEHQSNIGETDLFAAGLAIVRRDAFVHAGMFDEWRFPRPQAEALEFGDRLRAIGYRVLRRTDAQASHLKRWTVRDWVGVDLLERGMSVSRLNHIPNARARADRLYLASPLDALLAWTAATTATLGVGRGSVPLALAGLGCTVALVLHNGRFFVSLARARGVAFAAATIPLHLVTCAVYGVASALGRVLFHTVGEPQPDPVTQAFSEVGVRKWPPVPTPPASRPLTGSRPPSDAAGSNQ